MAEHVDVETGEVFPPYRPAVFEAGTYRRSAGVEALFKALTEAQSEIENVEKTGENEAFKRGGKPSRYASLAGALEEVRSKLPKHGLSVIQMPINGQGNNIGIVTLMGHISGQWIESTLYVAPSKFDAQGAGSVITYLRRYALMAMVGLAPEDDDGNAASVSAPETRQGASQTREAMHARINGANGVSGAQQAPAGAPDPHKLAQDHYRRIRAEIDGAKTIKQLNDTGVFGPSSSEAKAAMEAVDGGLTAWEKLVERDAGRRRDLAPMPDDPIDDAAAFA